MSYRMPAAGTSRFRPVYCLLTVLCALVLSACRGDHEHPVPEVDSLPRLNGHPDLNGLWQAIGTAHWDLEAHSARPLPFTELMGAMAAVPAGQSVVVGGDIPYLPDALEKRDRLRADWPGSDPEAACYLPGIPRATYMPYPFQIVQSDSEVFFAYSYATSNRIIYMDPEDHLEQAPVDLWMGWSNGRWEGDTLVIEVVSNDERTWFDRAGNHHSYQMTVTERYTPLGPNHLQYEATITDPLTFSEPWTIRMPLYRILDENAELLEFKCIEFAEPMLYGEFEKQEP